MKWKALSGREFTQSISKYTIDWDAPCRSKIQTRVKQWFEPYWVTHDCYEEVAMKGIIPKGRLRIDLLNLTIRVAVEVQGEQHYERNEFFHKNDEHGFLRQMWNDKNKAEWCDINEIKLIEISKDHLPLTREWFLEECGIYL